MKSSPKPEAEPAPAEKTVWKFQLPGLKDDFVLAMPKGASVLHFGEVDGDLCVWALVDPAAGKEDRRFRLAGTGHPIEEADCGRHVGTVVAKVNRSPFVLHLFETKP